MHGCEYIISILPPSYCADLNEFESQKPGKKWLKIQSINVPNGESTAGPQGH